MNHPCMKGGNMSSPKIPLFDIDWTLLKGEEINKKVHRDANDFALHTVYYQKNASWRDVFAEGSIDTKILIDILKIHGVSEEKAKSKMPKAIEVMTQYFLEHADEGHFEPMPGAIDLLSKLKTRNIPMGLLTGNMEKIGWEKLRRAGIKDYFSFGAFGSMAFQRVDLIEIARQEASKTLGKEVKTNELVIIGDSPLDIACARDGGIPVIAVGAGHFKTHELIHADLTLESLEEKDKILKFLNLA